MALVNNASGLYGSLGITYSDSNIVNLSQDTQDHLNTMPPMITSWQSHDIVANNVTGYTYNPEANAIHLMSNAANTILSFGTLTGSNSGINVFFTNIASNCQFLSLSGTTLTTNAQTFLYHTDRLSGVRSINADVVAKIDVTNLPYLDSATTAGKTLTYLTNQTDGIVNNSVMLACFSSILVANQINSMANTIANNANIISNSVSIYYDMSEVAHYSSNLTYNQVSQINNDFANVVSMMSTRELYDKSVYYNMRLAINNYNTTKSLVNPGETKTFLVNTFIGTSNGVSRINATS